MFYFDEKGKTVRRVRWFSLFKQAASDARTKSSGQQKTTNRTEGNKKLGVHM